MTTKNKTNTGTTATTTTRTVKIAIDMDGVMCNFVQGLVHTANSIWPNRLPDEYQNLEWNFSEVLSTDEMNDIWNKITNTPDFFATLAPLPGMYDYAHHKFQLYKHRIDTYFVTARANTVGMSGLGQTKQWLSVHGIDSFSNSVIVVDNPSDKVRLYKQLDIQFSLDDKPETVNDCTRLDNHFPGLLNASYNQQQYWNHLPRFATVGAFLDTIIQYVDMRVVQSPVQWDKSPSNQ